ncbi:amidohydrolase family protein [Acidobacteriota bacterium]
MKTRIIIGMIIVWLGMGLVLLSRSQEEAKAISDHGLILKNVQVLDVYKGKMSSPQNILIEGDRIKSVGPDIDFSQEGIQQIECAGKFAVPGLFDCHTHLAFLTTMGKTTLKSVLAKFVHNGVTQVRDVGGPITVLHDLSQATSSGEMLGPEFFYTGPMLEKPPLNWEEHNKILPGFTVPVDSKEEVDRIIPELIAGGAQLVKTFNKFDLDVYEYLLVQARKHSLRVVHDPGRPMFQSVPMDKAIDLGITSIEYAMALWSVSLKDELKDEHDRILAEGDNEPARKTFMAKLTKLGLDSVSTDKLEKIIDKMLANDVYSCPTLYVIELMARQSLPKDTPKEESEQRKKFFSVLMEVGPYFVGEMAKRKVKILVGQDNMNPMGTLVEMRLLSDCGMDESEVIKGATLYPARWLGEEDRLGSITPGKQANISIVDKNPLEDIKNIRNPYMVIKNGKIAHHKSQK